MSQINGFNTDPELNIHIEKSTVTTKYPLEINFHYMIAIHDGEHWAHLLYDEKGFVSYNGNMSEEDPRRVKMERLAAVYNETWRELNQ